MNCKKPLHFISLYFTLILLSFILISCGVSSNVLMGSSASSGYNLGTLPNGSSVVVSQQTFTASGGGSTTGSIGLSGGTSGISYTLSFSVNPSGPIVSTVPNPCVITSGSGQVCQLNFSAAAANAGTYLVTVSYIQNLTTKSGSKIQINAASGAPIPLAQSIIFIINSNPPIESGNLVISALTESSILVGESTTATVTLSGSESITTPISVNITSQSSAVMTVAPQTCSLTTASNICTITLTGVESGSATFSAAASGYTTVTSTALIIAAIPPMSPGTLVISALAESSILVGESTTATVTLTSSIGITTPITVNITSESQAVMTVAPTTCSLTTESNTCVITLTGVESGSTTFSAAASGYATVTSTALTVNSVTGMLDIFAGIVRSAGTPTPGAATSSKLRYPAQVAVDSNGNVYIADTDNYVIEKVTSAGALTIFAGTGSSGTPTPGPATSSKLALPNGVAVDVSGNVYISDTGNSVVEKVMLVGGIESLSIFAGTGSPGTPTPGPATSSLLNRPEGIAVDESGNLYIADTSNNRIEKVTPIGTLSFFAGTGSNGAPTAGPATLSDINNPYGVGVDGSGNVYIADTENDVIEKVMLVGGIESLSIFTGIVASVGLPTPGPATSSKINMPYGVMGDSSGNVYIADSGNNIIEKVTAGSLSIFAGSSAGTAGVPTVGPATSSELYFPEYVAVDSQGNVYISDNGNSVIEEVY